MTKTQVDVITSVQRCRRWPIAEKERIVAAIEADDQVREVLVERLRVGDIVVVRPGDIGCLPTVRIEGRSEVDETGLGFDDW